MHIKTWWYVKLPLGFKTLKKKLYVALLHTECKITPAKLGTPILWPSNSPAIENESQLKNYIIIIIIIIIIISYNKTN
jgi:hypothetical protein